MSSRRDQTKARVSSRQTRHDLGSPPLSIFPHHCLLFAPCLYTFYATVFSLPSYLLRLSLSDTVLCFSAETYCGILKLKHREICLLPHLNFPSFQFQDIFYHFFALLFYFSAFVLEAATTAASRMASIINSTETSLCVTPPTGNVFTLLDGRQYSINVAATVRICSAAVIHIPTCR